MHRNLLKYIWIALAVMSGAAWECLAQSSITLVAVNIGPTGSSGQTLDYGSDAAAIGGQWVKILSTAAGQWFEFTTPSIAAGSYQLSFTYRSDPTRAQHNLTIDGSVVGGTIDQYAPSPSAYPTVNVGTVTFGTSGPHVIRLTVTGKNA